MKTNAGTEPTPSRGADRIRIPRFIAIVSSCLSVFIVIANVCLNSEKGVGKKDETIYLSRTPERAAESLFTALIDGKTEQALKLCKGNTRKAVLDRSISRALSQIVKDAIQTQIQETSFRHSVDRSTDSTAKSQKPANSTQKVDTTRSNAVRERSTGKSKPPQNGKPTRAVWSKPNVRYRPPEPLLFSVHESHRERKDRFLLIGTLNGKKTSRIYLSDIYVTVEKNDSRWYVTRIRFE